MYNYYINIIDYIRLVLSACGISINFIQCDVYFRLAKRIITVYCGKCFSSS